MSVSLHYWAVPPSSGLFQRLQTDRAFLTLMGSLFCYGGGVFHFFDGLSAAERENILQDVINRHQKFLGPEPMARCLIEEFREEVERTRLSYAGVEQRRCSLEKTGTFIEERVVQALKDGREDASAFVGKLLYGDQPHGALKDREFDIEEFSSNPAYLCGNFVSQALVKEGAQVLSAIDAEANFFDDTVWQLQSFQRWRSVYMAAAAHDEALCTGVC
jgi:hypothetical protein